MGLPANTSMVDSDSRARTHLANERAFLAWLRTGLSLIALVLAAAQSLAQDLMTGIPVTTLFAGFLVICGVVITMIGGVHDASRASGGRGRSSSLDFLCDAEGGHYGGACRGVRARPGDPLASAWLAEVWSRTSGSGIIGEVRIDALTKSSVNRGPS